MSDPIRYDGWPKGMDNRRREFDMDDLDVLRDATNVDVLNSGRVRMRYGPGTLAFSDTGAHSVFSDGRKLLWATASTLKAAAPGASPRTLLTDARLATSLSWAALNAKSYFSNEYLNGSVNPLGAYEPWGIVPPAVAPTLAGDGGIRTVMVTCTFLVATVALDGSTVLEESGAPIAKAVACSDSGLITVSCIPQSSDARYAGTRLYTTGLNGTELFREVDLPPGVTTWFLRAPFGHGEALKTMLNSNPPPGQLLEPHNGAIYIAAGNVLYHTDPLRYGMVDNDKKFFMFPERITLVKSAGPSGMYVSADRTYFIEGIGTAAAQPKFLFDYKAIEGAAIHLPESEDVMWLSERGVVRGSAGGRAVNLTEKQIAMDGFTRAAMGLFERDGHRAVVVVGQASTPTPLLSSDWIADEAKRAAEIV